MSKPPPRQGSIMGRLLINFNRYRVHRRIVGRGYHSRKREYEGLTYHYYSSERGRPPLILLHGFLDDARTFRRAFDGIAPRRDFLALDAPGFGRSYLPPIRELWDARIFARALARFLVFELGLRDVPVLAHSMGGLIALHMAEYMRRVYRIRIFSRLHLIAPGALKLNPGDRDQRRRLLFPRNREEIRALLSALYHREIPELNNLVLDGLLGLWTQVGYYYLAENTVTEENDVFFTTARVRALKTPLTLYWGANDRVTPPALARRLARAVPGSRLRFFPNASHALHLEQPQEFLAAFLEELED